MREDLKILRFRKKLKVYATKNGNCRHNLNVQVMKERKDEVKDVQTPCLWWCNPRWQRQGEREIRNLVLAWPILNQADNSIHNFQKLHTNTLAEINNTGLGYITTYIR